MGYTWLPSVIPQGTWTIEEDKMKGNFVRKDSGKEITMIRELVGDELVQVSSI